MKLTKKTKIILSSLACILLFLIGVFFGYFAVYYHAENVDQYLVSSENVVVTQEKEYYFFDGKGEDDALVFYIGAKVEESAYAPLMYSLAENGVDCFLVKMPFRFALFGINKANEIIDNNSYDNWYLAGHSLGGVAAGEYLKGNMGKVSGLFLLGSYSTADLTNYDKTIVAIYGTEDMVLAKDKLEQSKANMPKTFFTCEINGGNHASFASYGEQKGDGTATISISQQIDQTTKEIISQIE